MTTPRKEHVDDLLDLYALGALEADEQIEVEEHLAVCSRCAAHLAQSKRVVDLLGWVPEQIQPSQALHDRIIEHALKDLAATPQPADAKARPKAWWRQLGGGSNITVPVRRRLSLAIATAALVLALLGNTVRMQSRMSALQADLALQQRVLAVLRDPNSRVVTLASTGATTAHTRLLIGPGDTEAYVLADALPSLPPSQTYQLWLIKDNQPAGAGLFSSDTHGTATVKIDSPIPLHSYQAAGVTVEPAGGSVKPTSKPILLGTF